jgi:hypothetical protein
MRPHPRLLETRCEHQMRRLSSGSHVDPIAELRPQPLGLYFADRVVLQHKRGEVGQVRGL